MHKSCWHLPWGWWNCSKRFVVRGFLFWTLFVLLFKGPSWNELTTNLRGACFYCIPQMTISLEGPRRILFAYNVSPTTSLTTNVQHCPALDEQARLYSNCYRWDNHILYQKLLQWSVLCEASYRLGCCEPLTHMNLKLKALHAYNSLGQCKMTVLSTIAFYDSYNQHCI